MTQEIIDKESKDEKIRKAISERNGRIEEIQKIAEEWFPTFSETCSGNLVLTNDEHAYNRDQLEKRHICQKSIEWADRHPVNFWKSADGDDLPAIGRKVLVILDDGKAVYAQRPPEYLEDDEVQTEVITRQYIKRYGSGLWNQPNVRFWLDLDLPKIKEDKL